MALNPADIATVSRLLDEALALAPAEREPWLTALPPELQRHVGALRDMLAQEAQMGTDHSLEAMPKLAADEAVAHADDRVGPYRLLHEIGRGGMGSVWLAERADGAYKRQVALKLPRLAWGAGLAERMAREREIGMLLEHPNIARLYDAGVDERGRPFLALEFVDGQPIDAWCEAQGLSVRDRLRLFVQVAKAVAYAHGRLVVHRDLKPSNVLVTPDGQAHLLDFGIAKLLLEAAPGEAGLTQEQGRVLTPHYASPEQVAGEAITVQSDVYSLGVLLYELLTSTLPIAPKRGTLGAVEEAILEGDAPLASSRVKDRATAKALRGEVDAILAMAMQRKPGRRYATADALALDIERHLNGETVSARPDSLGYRMRKAVRRHWLGVSAVSSVIVAVLTGSGVAVVQAQRATRSAERERVVKEFVADVFRVNARVEPKNATLRPESVHGLLENGAPLIEQRFSGQPELQAELYGLIGRVCADMGAFRQAAEYATRQIEALTLLRSDARQLVPAQLALAEALLSDGRWVDAELRALRALGAAKGDPRSELTAAVLLARIQNSLGKNEEAAGTLSAAERQLESQGTASSATRAWALYVRARLLVVQNRLDEALPIYQQAIDVAHIDEGQLSQTAALIGIDIGNRLALSVDGNLSKRFFDPAITVLNKLGGTHKVHAAYETARFAWRRNFLWGHDTATQAIEALQASRTALQASQLPIPEWFIPAIDFWTGTVRLNMGDVAAALPLIEDNVEAVRRGLSTPNELLNSSHVTATVMTAAGRHEVADKWWRGTFDERRRAGQTSHPFAAGDFRGLAVNLLMQGRREAAEAVLAGAPRFQSARGEGADPDRINRLLDRVHVQIALDRGESATALASLQRMPPGPDSDHFERDAYNRLLGEALCAAGQSHEGLALLRRRVNEAEQEDAYPHRPSLAHIRANTGLCALATGDRTSALRYATQSRAAFTAQPGVSPYYKAPLIKLERALGLRLPPV